MVDTSHCMNVKSIFFLNVMKKILNISLVVSSLEGWSNFFGDFEVVVAL